MNYGANKSGLVNGLLLMAGMASIWPVSIKAQTAVAPAFEVVTIKPASPDEKGGMLGTSDKGFVAHNQPLISVLKMAYHVDTGSNDQILGGPAWVRTERFDMDGKESPEFLERWDKMKGDEKFDQVRLMAQTMLQDRFKLKVHHETREIPVYALTVAKGGIKMKPSADRSADQKGWSGLQMQRIGQMEGRGATTEMVSSVLARQPEIGGRLILDKTGQTDPKAGFDFVLKWTPDMAAAAEGGAPGDASGPSLFTALQEELGLRLESTKASVDVIVIDSVEKPTEN